MEPMVTSRIYVNREIRATLPTVPPSLPVETAAENNRALPVNMASGRLTRRVFQVVHVVWADGSGAGQHVRFAQQRLEVTDVGVGHAGVLASFPSSTVWRVADGAQ